MLRLSDWLSPVKVESAEASKPPQNTRKLACGHDDWLLQSVVRQLLQALSLLHATNIVAGFIMPEHVFVYPQHVGSDDKTAKSASGSSSRTSSVRVSICGVPASRVFAAQHPFADPSVGAGEALPSAASDMWMVRMCKVFFLAVVYVVRWCAVTCGL